MSTKKMPNSGKTMPMSRDERAKEMGDYLFNNKVTIRQTAKVFGVSRATVHYYITKVLDRKSKLYQKVRKVLDTNKAERYSRGGIAKKAKYGGKRGKS